MTCKPLVDGDCYTQGVECCGVSCTAQANMTCQQTYQEQQFEECRDELRIDCDASCSAEGALFCDGEYVLSGQQLPVCLQELVTRSLDSVDVDANANVTLDENGTSAVVSPACVAVWPAGVRSGLPRFPRVSDSASAWQPTGPRFWARKEYDPRESTQTPVNALGGSWKEHPGSGVTQEKS